MGAIVKGVGSLIGGGKRRREQKAANQEFGGAKEAAAGFNFTAPQLGAAQTYEGQGYDAQAYQAGQLGPAAQASVAELGPCLLYTSPSPRDATLSRMPSSA